MEEAQKSIIPKNNLTMSKTKMTQIPVKVNGVRNELKEIRKSLDKLTSVLEVMLEISHSKAIKHTNTYEKSNSNVDVASDWMHIREDYD